MPERKRLRRKLLQLSHNERSRFAGWLAWLTSTPEDEMPGPATYIFEATLAERWEMQLEEIREWRTVVSEVRPDETIIIGGDSDDTSPQAPSHSTR